MTAWHGFANLADDSRAHDVFISYASEDREVAEEVCRTLEASGIACWMAPPDIGPGEFYARAIIAGIRGCRAMVVVFSSHANASDHIDNEVSSGFSRRIPIVPFRIDECELSEDLEYYLAARHWLNTSSRSLEPHLRQLAGHLARTLGRAAAATPPPAPPVVPGPRAGEVRTNPDDGEPYVWVPPGTFQMGCSPGLR